MPVEVAVTQFRTEITSRIATTRADLERAHLVGDEYLVEVRLGELEGLARLAAEHGIEVEGVAESLARFGPTTPARGTLLGVDLRERPLPRDPLPSNPLPSNPLPSDPRPPHG